MTDFGKRVGDMKRSIYDPDEDGVIALAQTEADITAAGTAVLIGIHAALANAHHTPPTVDPGEGFIFLDPGSYNAIVQGTYILLAASTTRHIGVIYNSSRNDQDAINWKAYLAAGTYTLVYIGSMSYKYGITDFYIDTTEVASFDMYFSGSAYMNIKKQTGIVVASSGIKTIKAIIDGKNVAATGYTHATESIVLYRTA